MKIANEVKNQRLKCWIDFITVISVIILAAYLCSLIRLRYDLTEDKRYTLSQQTKKILSELKNDVFIQVYLDGDIPIPLKRLKRSVNDILEEFRVVSKRKIDYEFINPSEGKDVKLRDSHYQSLMKKGLTPINVRAGDTEGGSSQKIIFPGMIVNYNGTEVPVNFLNNSTSSYEENILRSTEGLEYEMIQTISTLSSDTIYKVAFLEGNNEIPEIETADITMNLAKFFTVDRGTINGKQGVLNNYSAVIVAGPEKEFNETDKFILDQYIMNGGKVVWLFDEVAVNADSLTYGETVGLYRPLNIEDQLFWYGARVNPYIVQDIECMVIRLKVGMGNSDKQLVPAPWVYYPLLIPSSNHPITRNLNRVAGRFTNYIDTVGLDKSIHKKILLTTSRFSRTISPPVVISLKEAELTPKEIDFTKSNLPVAVLLEGRFTSAFKNRALGNISGSSEVKFKGESKDTKMIVVADADIIRNEVRRMGMDVSPLTLGQDRYTGEIYGNSDFLVNCLNYLVDDHGIMELRSRELKLRLLDRVQVTDERLKWQLLNIFCPVLIVVLSALVYNFIRKRQYTKY
jgi:ABC-2 type transport system permease protein